ncbi:hypothetical protein IMCC3088_2557 [Aequoribacter fuscus]|uniref:Uncharacterized protein n=1 Tax=Aequoribacter fuscus TaxID=2518989 RepID=F3L4F6_9GAMM|nr:hypothetical protein IMCC3088_2557 [Aequoribacter fuscus]
MGHDLLFALGKNGLPSVGVAHDRCAGVSIGMALQAVHRQQGQLALGWSRLAVCAECTQQDKNQ